jgi:xylose isomerase
MNGAASNPDFAVVGHAAHQVKAAIDATIKLGGARLHLLGRPGRLYEPVEHRYEAGNWITSAGS